MREGEQSSVCLLYRKHIRDAPRNKKAETNGEPLSDILAPRNCVLVHVFWFTCQVRERYRGARAAPDPLGIPTVAHNNVKEPFLSEQL